MDSSPGSGKGNNVFSFFHNIIDLKVNNRPRLPAKASGQSSPVLFGYLQELADGRRSCLWTSATNRGAFSGSFHHVHFERGRRPALTPSPGMDTFCFSWYSFKFKGYVNGITS